MQGRLTILKNASGETVFPVTSSEAVISSDGATTLEQKINTVGDKTVILNQEVENAKSLMAQKINFTVDSTSNVEIPQIDEKLNSINNKYETVTSQLEHIETEKATKLEVDVERKRIDSFTNLAEGSTTGDAELIDGRIDIHANTFSNIGNSIREQNERLSNGLYIKDGALSANKMKFIIQDNENLLDNSILKLNKYINSSGVVSNNSNFIAIDNYIELDNTKTYKFKYYDQAYYAYYDEDKVFISFIQDNSLGDKERTLTIPENAKYIRISLKEEYFQSAKLQEGKISENSHLANEVKINGANIDDKTITLDKTDIFDTKIQYIRKSNIVSGKYYQHNSINQNTSVNASYYEPIRIYKDTTYHYAYLYAYFCTIVYDDGVIKALTDYTNNPSNTTPSLSGNFTAEKDGYIYISFNNLVSNKDYMFCNGELPSEYLEGVLELKLDNIELKTTANKNTTVTIKQDGTGDYTSLRECFESIKPSENNLYTVEIYKGTYNINSYYTSEEWSNEGFVGLFVPDYVTLKGVGNKTEIIIIASDTEYRTNLSTLNLRNTSSLINVTVIAEKLRYAVHDDFASNDNAYYKRYCKNCDFIGRDLRFWSVYGSGCKNGCDWEFIDCNFEFDGEVTGKYGFSNHNNIGWDREGFIKFDNCRFGGDGLRFGSLNTNANNINTQVKLIGCKMNELKLTEENAVVSGAGILFTVTGYGNKITKTTISNTDGKDYSGNIDLI